MAAARVVVVVLVVLVVVVVPTHVRTQVLVLWGGFFSMVWWLFDDCALRTKLSFIGVNTLCCASACFVILQVRMHPSLSRSHSLSLSLSLTPLSRLPLVAQPYRHN